MNSRRTDDTHLRRVLSSRTELDVSRQPGLLLRRRSVESDEPLHGWAVVTFVK